jgi:dTDP-4-amino-4,6-dideoxygalactose transaminase
MQPRLTLDTDVSDLVTVFRPLPSRRRRGIRDRFTTDILSFWLGRPGVVGLSVRSLLLAYLQAGGLAPGSSVVMSAVNIAGMREIVEAEGFSVHPVDIRLNTLLPDPKDIEAALRDTGARCVIIAQLFGAVSSLKKHAQICRRHGAVLIEDAAQAFAGDFYRGDADADLSLFSFGPIKRATALGGAVAIARDPGLAIAMAAHQAQWPAASEAAFRQRALKYLGLKLLSWPPVYGLLVRGLEMMGRDPDTALGGVARGFRSGDLRTQLRFRPSKGLLRLLARRLSQPHDHSRRAEAAQAIFDRWGAGRERPGAKADKHAWWLAPMLCDDAAAEVKQLRRFGIDATRGATSLRAYGGDNATALLDRVVYLPIGR